MFLTSLVELFTKFLSCGQKEAKATELIHQMPPVDPLEMNPSTKENSIRPVCYHPRDDNASLHLPSDSIPFSACKEALYRSWNIWIYGNHGEISVLLAFNFANQTIFCTDRHHHIEPLLCC